MWPYINAYDNFMVPQNLPCLAGYIRKRYKVKILDCMPLKIGWKTLEKIIRDINPKIVAAGENHALFSEEVVKLFKLAKKINPNIWTIAGGTHFSFLAEEYLQIPEIDFIVRGEGEETFLEICDLLLQGGGKEEAKKVKGISFSLDGKIISTPPRPLIKNLDELPMPAYDLLPMDKYGKSKYLFASYGSTIHHSRGCTSSCDFCGFWIGMAEVKEDGEGKYKLIPKWRTKSPERTLEEVKYLKRFGRHFLVWVDDTFNVNPSWSNKFAELILKEGIKTRWYAFMRADYILRDEKLGVMEKLVRAGLQHISIGAERPVDEELKSLGKGFYNREILKKCIEIIRRKYPHIFIQTTFIVGLPDDTEEDFWETLKFAKELSPDYAGFHPLMPIPGTKMWYKLKEKNLIETQDFNLYDLMNPVIKTKLGKEKVEELTYKITRKYVSLPWFIKGILGGDYRRRMYIWWLTVSLKITISSILNLKIPFNQYHNLIYPPWYFE